jgi:hypothetical protein
MWNLQRKIYVMKKFDVEGNIQTNRNPSYSISRHREAPADEQVNRFIEICNEFSHSNPNDIIGTND